ncbi:MAG TPA: hypothetical protein VFN25_01880 [Dokdonella sp.]|uniref:hypothetical protein n=1 Tax=Dokdonella sp. TaxID=2291710 RepID=UPI002D80DB55|nr:hypothetical protein [Dokdonella sp.]HET9031633.1 hypothetical protein [Dokdonella sp.]
MSPRITSLGVIGLVALLFAVAAQAGEVSMDARGYSAENEQAADSSQTRADEPLTAEADIASVETRTRIRPKWRNVTTSQDQPLLSDTLDTDSAKPEESAGGSSSSNISVPAKPRNRWQSLVPGAIK